MCPAVNNNKLMVADPMFLGLQPSFIQPVFSLPLFTLSLSHSFPLSLTLSLSIYLDNLLVAEQIGKGGERDENGKINGKSYSFVSLVHF